MKKAGVEMAIAVATTALLTAAGAVALGAIKAHNRFSGHDKERDEMSDDSVVRYHSLGGCAGSVWEDMGNGSR
jgi:hypothetical protein